MQLLAEFWSCHEETGETVDEIAEAIASEFSPGTSNVPHLSDGETDSDEEGTEATENPFRIRSPKNLEDILGSLEEYCYDTDSACLPLIFQMRKHFNNERIRASLWPLDLFRKRYARANVISIALALKKYFALALTQALKTIFIFNYPT